jgi:D-alanyl-D-alanine carboxypeptidase
MSSPTSSPQASSSSSKPAKRIRLNPDAPGLDATVTPDPIAFQAQSAKFFFQRMGQLCKDGEFSDVTFIVKQRHFRAHRFVISVWSPPLHAMLTSTMKESAQSEIVLEVRFFEFLSF